MSVAIELAPAAVFAACRGIASRKVLADPTVAPPVRTHAQSVQELIKIVDQFPQLEIPVRHTFLPGEYWREITMPAGMTGVGHIHKHEHLCIVMTGHAIVTMGDGQKVEIRAPAIFISQPGAQRAFQVFEDLRWITVHQNPRELRDIVELEREIFELPPEMVAAAIPVNDYRMTKRALCQDS